MRRWRPFSKSGERSRQSIVRAVAIPAAESRRRSVGSPTSCLSPRYAASSSSTSTVRAFSPGRMYSEYPDTFETTRGAAARHHLQRRAEEALDGRELQQNVARGVNPGHRLKRHTLEHPVDLPRGVDEPVVADVPDLGLRDPTGDRTSSRRP